MARPPKYRNRCWCCGTWFDSLRQTATYCNQSCRQRASRRNRGKEYTAHERFFRPHYRCRPIRLR